MIDVEAEVNKHRNCKDRSKLEGVIQEYKNLVFKYASNLTLAGRYNSVVLKLQEICDKLPNPLTRNTAARAQGVPLKTASVTSEENEQISAAWKQKTGK
ncbi:MAG: hypothetical protein FWG29_06615 [Treponema sp.]|nr:hypothetical protein [Treponema sp.]